jgi:hypothetical protein
MPVQSIFTWAWEELFQGVNYFRRGLGSFGYVNCSEDLESILFQRRYANERPTQSKFIKYI